MHEPNLFQGIALVLMAALTASAPPNGPIPSRRRALRR